MDRNTAKRLVLLGLLILLLAGCTTGIPFGHAGERWTKTVRYVFVDAEGGAVEHEWTVETPERPDDWLQLFSIQNRVTHTDAQTTKVTP